MPTAHPPLHAVDVIDHVLPLVPGLTAALAAGSNVMEAHCGEALVTRGLAARFPRSRFAGTSPSSDDVAQAHRRARAEGLANAWFYQLRHQDAGRAAIYDVVLLLDLIAESFGDGVLAPLVAQLKPGGLFFLHVHEFSPFGARQCHELLRAAGLTVLAVTELGGTAGGRVARRQEFSHHQP
jgi:trans-aconitate methyltransferase